MEDNALGEKAPMKADDLNGSDHKAPVSRIASRQHRQILEISLSRSERISFARDKAPEYWADLFRQADPDGSTALSLSTHKPVVGISSRCCLPLF